MKRVLFLCTGNSARSILAEALMNHWGAPRFQAMSAGSRPTGRVNPGAIAELRRHGIATEGTSSKSWDEFTAPGAVPIDMVITVCDNAAGETCPLFPGKFVRAHWGVADPPAAGNAAQVAAAFAKAYDVLESRVRRLVALPVESMSAEEVQLALESIAS